MRTRQRCPEHPGDDMLYCAKCVNAITEAAVARVKAERDPKLVEAITYVTEILEVLDDQDVVVSNVKTAVGILNEVLYLTGGPA